LEKLSSEVRPTIKGRRLEETKKENSSLVDSQKERRLESSQQSFSTISMNENTRVLSSLFIVEKES